MNHDYGEFICIYVADKNYISFFKHWNLKENCSEAQKAEKALLHKDLFENCHSSNLAQILTLRAFEWSQTYKQYFLV